MRSIFKLAQGFALMGIPILVGMILEGNRLACFINFPAILIVYGTIFGFWALSFSLSAIKISFNSLLADKINEEHARISSLLFFKSANISLCMGFVSGILGLVKVLGHLSEPNKVGEGIAYAFVAVLYGYFGYIIFTAFDTSILSRSADLNFTSKQEKESIIGIASACFALILGSIFTAVLLRCG